MRRAATYRPARLAVVAAFVAGLASGLVLAVSGPALATHVDGTYKKLRIFGQVLSYVQTHYVDDVSEDELIYDAINGLLRDLDPHTTFMRPAEYQKLREDTAGEFGGLGIRLITDDVSVFIEGVSAQGAADRAGLLTGDRIVSVDQKSVAGMRIDEVAERLRGVPGTKVVVGIVRAGWGGPRDISLVRRYVHVDSVDHELLEGGVGYVRIRTFQERTDQEVAEALADLRRKAREQSTALTALVVDLRDNPGGLLDEGVKVADRFLDEGDIVRTEGKNPRSVERQVAHARGTEENYPMAVLINGGTASASEILAGALQDHGRALVVGTKSYGKGSVQTLFGLEDGSGLKLTIARYFTPKGRNIQKVGIVPDLPVLARKDAGELDPELLASAVGRRRGDTQLLGALDALKRRAQRPGAR
jgi:carboxyl-terminal processing protease